MKISSKYETFCSLNSSTKINIMFQLGWVRLASCVCAPERQLFQISSTNWFKYVWLSTEIAFAQTHARRSTQQRIILQHRKSMHDWAAPNDLKLINRKVFFSKAVQLKCMDVDKQRRTLITDNFLSNHSNSGFYFQFQLEYCVAHCRVDSRRRRRK